MGFIDAFFVFTQSKGSIYMAVESFFMAGRGGRGCVKKTLKKLKITLAKRPKVVRQKTKLGPKYK